MAMDLTGIRNINDYYSSHYLSTIFEDNANEVISQWRARSKATESPTPWSLLRGLSRDYHLMHEKGLRQRSDQLLPDIQSMAEQYLHVLGYEKTEPFSKSFQESQHDAYIFSEVKKANGAPLLWVLWRNILLIVAVSITVRLGTLRSRTKYWQRIYFSLCRSLHVG